MTRADLAALTGISRSTVNQSVGQLLAAGRVAEVDAHPGGAGSGSGRPASRLRAVASSSSVAGIDFGHSHVYVAIGDPLGSLVDLKEVGLDVDLRATEAMDVATDLLDSLCREHSVENLSGLVAGIPGPVDLRTGVVRSPTILSGWVGLDPARELQQRLGMPVHVENDAVLGALGELQCGAGREFTDFLYVKASHGVGASVIIDGQPYRGVTGLAGEIGHSQLAGRTEMCRCGNRGCLEAVVSVDTLKEQIAHTRPGADPQSLQLAALDDPIAARILEDAGRTVGRVLAVLCNLLNPAALIIGGELASSGRPFIDGVDASVRRHAQPATADALRVVPAALGVRSEVIGALQLATTVAAT